MNHQIEELMFARSVNNPPPENEAIDERLAELGWRGNTKPKMHYVSRATIEAVGQDPWIGSAA